MKIFKHGHHRLFEADEETAKIVSDMLLDVKYILTKDRTYEDFYERVYADEENGIYGYRNPYALSLGYAVDEELLSVDLEESFSPMVRINELTAAITGRYSVFARWPLEKGRLLG